MKILPRYSLQFKKTLTYIEKGAEKNVVAPYLFKNNIRSDLTDIDAITKEFMINESYRKRQRKGSITYYHEILSFHNEEKSEIFTKEMLDDIIAKYISLRGPTGVMYGSVHFDKSHIHIHIISSGLHYRTGTSYRLSKAQLFDIKTKMTEYLRLRHPSITKSFPHHGKGKAIAKERAFQAMQKDKRMEVLKSIQPTLQECFTRSKTERDFLDRLSKNKVEVYERTGKAAGIIQDKVKIRFTRLNISLEKFETKPPVNILKNKELKVSDNKSITVKVEKQINNTKNMKTEKNVNKQNSLEKQRIEAAEIIKSNKIYEKDFLSTQKILANLKDLRTRGKEHQVNKEKEPTGIKGFRRALAKPFREAQMSIRDGRDYSIGEDPQQEFEL